MKPLRKLLAMRKTKDQDLPSIEYIASKMTPVDESNLRLPRSFAHTVRGILENEEKLTANKAMDSVEE